MTSYACHGVVKEKHMKPEKTTSNDYKQQNHLFLPESERNFQSMSHTRALLLLAAAVVVAKV